MQENFLKEKNIEGEKVTAGYRSDQQIVRSPIASGIGKQDIYTPDDLAHLIVAYFCPSGRICEPCKGDGPFVRK